MRIKKIINYAILSWYNTNFSVTANKEMYGDQLGELLSDLGSERVNVFYILLDCARRMYIHIKNDFVLFLLTANSFEVCFVGNVQAVGIHSLQSLVSHTDKSSTWCEFGSEVILYSSPSLKAK